MSAQDPGTGDHPDLQALVSDLVAAAHAFQAAAGARARLTPTELAVLALVRSQPRIAGQLAAATQLTTGAITRVLDALEKRGLVTRVPDPGDRRRVVVAAVAERVAAVEALFGPMTDAASAVQRTFPEADQRTIARFLAATTKALREQAADLRTGPAESGPVRLAAEAGSATRGLLSLAGGLRDLRIVGGAGDFPAGSLYQGTFTGSTPTSEIIHRPDETEARVGFARHRPQWRWRASAVADSTLALNPGLAWAITVRGGAHRLTVDTTALDLRAFSLTGGGNDVRLRLGRPAGRVQLSLTGGATALRVQRPAGVPVALRVRGGVSSAVIDGERHGGTGGWTLGPGVAGDHYLLAVTGGVNDLDISVLDDGPPLGRTG